MSDIATPLRSKKLEHLYPSNPHIAADALQCTNGLHLRLQMPMCLTLLLRDAATTMLALFPFPRVTFSLPCVFGRMMKMKLLLAGRYLRNVRSPSRSPSGCCNRCSKYRRIARA
jgi:hypothetical protein